MPLFRRNTTNNITESQELATTSAAQATGGANAGEYILTFPAKRNVTKQSGYNAFIYW